MAVVTLLIPLHTPSVTIHLERVWWFDGTGFISIIKLHGRSPIHGELGRSCVTAQQ